MVLGFAAQAYINSSYRKFSSVPNDVGMTGAQIARSMLDANGLNDVAVQGVSGTLSDHYDPRSRVVRLSEGVYGETSVSAMAIACHECGHAVQHARGYVPMKVRTALVPVERLAHLAVHRNFSEHDVPGMGGHHSLCVCRLVPCRDVTRRAQCLASWARLHHGRRLAKHGEHGRRAGGSRQQVR